MQKFLQSNIATTERIIRAAIGLVLLAAAVAASRVHWLASLGLGLGGLFCLFEVLRGCCFARACGLKTSW